MSEMLRELEEDMKRERWQNIWNRFGKLLVLVSVGVIVATIASVVWQDHKRTHAMAQTSQFIKGTDRMDMEDYKGAVAAFSELTGDSASPYYALAMLRKAQALALSGDAAGARQCYEQLGAQTGALADLGKLLAVAHGSTIALNTAADAPFHFSSAELAAWQLLQQGKKAEAATRFVSLRDQPDAPPSLHERAKDMAQLLAPQTAANRKKETGHE